MKTANSEVRINTVVINQLKYRVGYLLVCVEERADGTVRGLGAHALIVLPLLLQVGRFVLPQVSQRFSPALPLQTALLSYGRLLWSLCHIRDTLVLHTGDTSIFSTVNVRFVIMSASSLEQ